MEVDFGCFMILQGLKEKLSRPDNGCRSCQCIATLPLLGNRTGCCSDGNGTGLGEQKRLRKLSADLKISFRNERVISQEPPLYARFLEGLSSVYPNSTFYGIFAASCCKNTH
ncbi:MAG: hypothetical protein IPH45_17480 [Bacteroidales bacterium]|nr:hypothetical protein [Bacteroidales bacterium]